MDSKNYAIITGASSGIGRECANQLAATGKNLILMARRLEKLEEMKKELEAENDIEVSVYKVDVKNTDGVRDFYKKIADKNVDVLVNNAGLACGADTFEEASWDDFENMIQTNVKGFTAVGHFAIPFLKKTKGHIVNISSIAGYMAYPSGSVYCGTKAYVQMISRALRLELADTEVRVTDIAPGVVETDFWKVRFKGDEEKAKKAYTRFIPLQASDVVDCILFSLTRPKHVNIDHMLVMPTEDRR